MQVRTKINELSVGDVFTHLGESMKIQIDEIIPQVGQGLGILVVGKKLVSGDPYSHRFMNPHIEHVNVHHD